MLFAKKATLAAKSDLYRKYLARKLTKEFPRYAREQWAEFEPDDVLRYVGLATYKPARVSMAGVGAFLIGCAVCGIAAMLLTPKSGPEIRHDVKDKAMGYIGKQGILSPEKGASA
ncbi:MAG TPA: YtxH domain-containing protein [Myxococcaceae bacterium]|nr:YtxH domain-containing protein [Myxococcaceae bacterium]